MWFPYKYLIGVLSSIFVVRGQNIYGDGLVAPTSPLIPFLQNMTNTTFSNYAVIGSKISQGWVTSIPEQYLLNRDPVPDYVIFNGGGNDMQPFRKDCEQGNAVCYSTLNTLVLLLYAFIEQMRFDGVKSIIYVGPLTYPHLASAVDQAYSVVENICKAKDACFVVDLRAANITLSWDGVHPTKTGYKRMAAGISNVLHKNGIIH